MPPEGTEHTHVVKELRLLENPSHTAKATEIRRIVQIEDGARVACDEIEKRLISVVQ